MEEASGKSQDFEVLLKDLDSRASSLLFQSSSLTSDKNSFMDLKINLLLNYLITSTNQLYQESREKPTEDLKKSLIQHRCFIERLKPLDHKLQYQLDKIASGNIEEELKMKPNPDSMDTELRINEKPGIYKPPKMQAAIFHDKKTKEERDEERLKKKLARSTLVKNLKEEMGDNPIEIKSGKNKRLRDIEEMQKNFEEENFTRVNLSKKDRKMRRKLEKIDEDDENEDVSALIKLIRPDKKKLEKSIQYSRKKQKFDD
jgi:U3 small nucleolar ribonucleoprotein protein LCP5